MHTPATLSILIPAYNEEGTIAQLLQKVVDARVDPTKIAKEIIVINDGSKDSTQKEVEQFIKTHAKAKITLINKPNGGKGSAIREGITRATGDIIIIQDADLEYDPEDYAGLVEPILRGLALVVYGSRYYLPGQRHEAWSMHTNKHGLKYLSFAVGGRLITWATNILYGTHLTDEPTCYKVFRADVLKNIPLQCTGFEFCPEVTAKVAKRGIRIVEMPIAFYPRTVAEGKKIKWSDGLEGIWTLLKYRF
ncbi:glycosyltransferase family 2 protein [Candidatus Woesearchaeota archaeon]|nr:glycosyltransferase family 2 protein [Candidatus Woesearchaeota archaeon]